MLRVTIMAFEKIFDDAIMAFETIRPFLRSKKGMEMTMKEIIGLIIALMVLVVIGVGLYLKINPNPDRVAGCFTEIVRAGPFG